MERVRRRWWTMGVSVLATFVVLGAVLSGLFQVAVMTLPGYRQQLSDYISRVADRPIDIGGIALVWSRFQPQLELADIVVYGDDGESPALSAERLRLGFGLLRLIRGDTFPDSVELSGLELAVEIDRNNQVSLRGMDTIGRFDSQKNWRRELDRFEALRLEDCTILVDDARLTGKVPRFHLVEAVARRRLNGASLDVSLELPAFMGQTAEFEGRIDGDLADPATWQGRWTLSVEQLLRLPWLEARLPGYPRLQFGDADLTLSGGIDRGRVDSADLQFTAASIAGRREQHLAQISGVDLVANARRQADTWKLDVSKLGLTGASGPWPATQLRLQWTPLAEGGGDLQADAGFVRLQDVAPWAMLGRDPSLARLAGISGELSKLVVRARLGKEKLQYGLRAQLDGLNLQAGDKTPGFSGLRGEISATEAGGRLALAAQPFRLEQASIFAAPVDFERVDGQLEWTHDAEGWRVNMPSFAWALSGSKGGGDLQLMLPADPEASPEIRLVARFSAEDVLRLKPYVPVNWGEPLRKWLDRAVISGRVPQGRLRLEGPLRKFPFKDAEGVFELDVDVADSQLAFAPDWPAAEQVAARLQFRAGALTVVGSSGRIAGNRILRMVANIPEFKDPVLNLDGEVEGESARFYEFLRASPLAPRLSGLLTRTQVKGPAAVSIKLALPLKDMKQAQIQGKARLKGVELLYKGLDEPFTGLQGEVAFTGESASAEKVAVQFYGVPGTASLKPESKNNLRLIADLDYALEAEGERLSRFLPALLRPYMSGSAHWRADLVIGPAADGVRVSSDLVGVAVDLPAPLGKPAGEALPLNIHIGTPAAPTASAAANPVPVATDNQPLRIGVAYGERLGGDIVLSTVGNTTQTQRVLLNLGSGTRPQAQQSGVRVTGSVAELDAGAWIATVGRSAADAADRPEGVGPGDGLKLQSIDVHADRLYYQGYTVGGVQLGYRPRPGNGNWTTTLGGEGAEGTINWEAKPAPQLIARMKKLSIAALPRGPVDTTPNKPGGEPLDPARLPTLDVDIEQLRVGKADLGKAGVVTERIEGGQRLSTFNTSGAELDMKAEGEWRRLAGASNAQLKFSADSKSIGELLEGLGYVRNLSAQRSRFNGGFEWPLTVAGLDWTQARGKLDLDLESGTVRAVEPGAGRALGLLNFYALPRRLLLDFSDVVSKGLGFDRIHGHFDTDAGDARTDDLLIESPSLKVELRGRIGLAARDYDQRVKVYPDVSGGVALGALLLGGPAAGAIALIAQEVLDKPLDQVTQLSYRVTGSWDNPEVKRAD